MANSDAISVPRGGLSEPRSEDRSLATSAERVFDIVFALAALVFAAPLFIVLGILIRLDSAGPIVFTQTRVGQNGRRFHCYKLRSMVVDAPARLDRLLANDPSARDEWARDHKLRNDPRITAIGGFLRRSSLDELPQLFNILRGDMSWVGPRPIVHEEIAKYGRWYRHYARTKPGLTGMWQVSGRNDVAYRRRIAFDILFARSRSMRLYFYILLMTIPAVLSRKGTY